MTENPSCGCAVGKNVSHGMRYTREYKIYSGMKQRCLNKKSKDFSRYGGKGITIVSEWEKSFENFFEDMGCAPTLKHQIERIDTLKGYSKDNCIWATPKQNACNRRTSKTWIIKGKKFDSAEDAAAHFGVSDMTIHRWCKGGGRVIKKMDCNCFNRY